jgi:ubiquinone/menaquinone biosynthesis C-methylase UbiE
MGLTSGVGHIGWPGVALRPERDEEYRPFPDVARRNRFQEALEVPALVRALRLARGQRILEVGCGRGVALPPLVQRLRPKRLVGLDVDGELLETARARLRGVSLDTEVELRQADVRALPFPDASFDLVLDFGTCYHVARRAQALREISRVLVEGGRFVHETRLSQLLSHPVRSWGRRLPLETVAELAAEKHALLWASRVKRATSCRSR